MEKETMKHLGQKMNLSSDLFSRVVFGDRKACEELVQIGLKRRLHIISVTPQKDISSTQYHSVVLDILAESEKGERVHVEFQITDDDDHLKRVRYCNGCIDTHMLKKGQKYRELPDVFHLFISMKDFLGGGKTVYEVERGVKGDKEHQVDVENGCHEVYVNLEVPLEDGSELDSLLRYIRDTTKENEDARFQNIVRSVNECREEGFDMKYYSSQEFYEEGVKDGREEGRKESERNIISSMLQENLSPDIVSRCIKCPVEYVYEVQEELLQTLGEEKPDYHAK